MANRSGNYIADTIVTVVTAIIGRGCRKRGCLATFSIFSACITVSVCYIVAVITIVACSATIIVGGPAIIIGCSVTIIGAITAIIFIVGIIFFIISHVGEIDIAKLLRYLVEAHGRLATIGPAEIEIGAQAQFNFTVVVGYGSAAVVDTGKQGIQDIVYYRFVGSTTNSDGRILGIYPVFLAILVANQAVDGPESALYQVHDGPVSISAFTIVVVFVKAEFRIFFQGNDRRIHQPYLGETGRAGNNGFPGENL